MLEVDLVYDAAERLFLQQGGRAGHSTAQPRLARGSVQACAEPL